MKFGKSGVELQKLHLSKDYSYNSVEYTRQKDPNSVDYNRQSLKRIFFDIALPEKEDLVAFAINTNSVDSGEPSEKAKRIMQLYADDVIDLETAEFAIRRLHHL